MTRREISARARNAIALELSVNPARVVDGAELRRALGGDALSLLNLKQALERDFAIRISDGEAEFCETVGTLIDLVETKVENRRVR